MRLIAYVLLSVALVTIAAAHADTALLSGRFQGTGRACYGVLTIEARTISWQTPFSHCKSMPYELIGHDEQGAKTTTTYRLGNHGGNCRYAILTLAHEGAADDTGWEVTVYGSQQNYAADKAGGYQTRSADMTSCYLIREPGPSTIGSK